MSGGALESAAPYIEAALFMLPSRSSIEAFMSRAGKFRGSIFSASRSAAKAPLASSSRRRTAARFSQPGMLDGSAASSRSSSACAVAKSPAPMACMAALFRPAGFSAMAIGLGDVLACNYYSGSDSCNHAHEHQRDRKSARRGAAQRSRPDPEGGSPCERRRRALGVVLLPRGAEGCRSAAAGVARPVARLAAGALDVRALRARVSGVHRRAAGGARLRPGDQQQALRAVRGHRARQEADLPAGAALLLFPGPAADPVLRARAVPVAGRTGARDRRHLRRAAGSDATARRVRAVRAGEARPSAERAGGHAEQSGMERLLSVEER